MAVDPRRRQKKLERRRAKEKAQKKKSVRIVAQSISTRLEYASTAPILDCCATTQVWESGMGEVLVSRQLSGGNVAFTCFLLDMYCLGVKDAMACVDRLETYQSFYRKIAQRYTLRHLRPECARKLVEGAVEFARQVDIAPHPDYRAAKLIFGDISTDACTEQFVYGKDGRHFFMQGPRDNPERVREIIRKLQKYDPGPDGPHFVIGGPGRAGLAQALLSLPDEDTVQALPDEEHE
jgi:hypothetical protein